MVDIVKKRMTAETDGEFVVFLIGMRINKWWKIHKWLPTFCAMYGMLKELEDKPDLGMLSYELWFSRTIILVQYWKSYEHLENYSKNKTLEHLPAWTKFNKKVGSNGDVGIWHESYLSGRGRYECVYNNMPEFGLGKALKHVPATGKYQHAADRLKAGSD